MKTEIEDMPKDLSTCCTHDLMELILLILILWNCILPEAV